MGKFDKFLKKNGDCFYFIFRILVGFMFFQHGAMKMFGWFGGNMASGQMWVVGLVEVLGGIAVLFGFWTRLASLGGAVLMLIAYFKAHLPSVWWNITSGKGELALMYFAVFLVLMVYGAKKWSLEKKLMKKELF